MKQLNDSETLIKFPCDFHLKIIGHNNEQFKTEVLTIVRKHCSLLKENALAYRNSQKKKYLSMTVTIRAESKIQLNALYQELSENKQIIMTL